MGKEIVIPDGIMQNRAAAIYGDWKGGVFFFHIIIVVCLFVCSCGHGERALQAPLQRVLLPLALLLAQVLREARLGVVDAALRLLLAAPAARALILTFGNGSKRTNKQERVSLAPRTCTVYERKK